MQKQTRSYGWVVGTLVCAMAGVMFVVAAFAALLMSLVLGIRVMTRYLRVTAFGLPVRARKRTLLVSRPRRRSDLAAAPHRAK